MRYQYNFHHIIKVAAKAIRYLEMSDGNYINIARDRKTIKQYLPQSEKDEININDFKRPDNPALFVRMLIQQWAPDIIIAIQQAYYNLREYPEIINDLSDDLGAFAGLINDFAIKFKFDMRDCIDFINEVCDNLDMQSVNFDRAQDEYLRLSSTSLSKEFEIAKANLRDITDEIHDILISVENKFDIPVNLSIGFDYPDMIS